jgi:hypothetical protein
MRLLRPRLRLAVATSAAAALIAPAAMAAGYHYSGFLSAQPAESPAPAPVVAVGSAVPAEDEVLGMQAVLKKDLRHMVLAAVTAEGGVPTADGSACPVERLRLSWTDPGKGYRTGAFISPLGPEPTDATEAVNGVVLCASSHVAYLGFDAVRTASGWDVEIVPDPAGGVDDEKPGTNRPDKAPKPKPVAGGLTGAPTGAGIEGYARYEGQSTCSPDAKPGTLALRNLLLARYPSTVSLGISRACSVGGRSEHKEGRAFDWGANVGSSADVAAVHSFLNAVMATDSHGNRHALVRRMGIMYVIWNHQIWSAYRADAGWRPYSGASPHTDHVHISLSWAGALGKTSFWSGKVVEGLSAVPMGGGSSGIRNAAYHRTKPTRTTTTRAKEPNRERRRHRTHRAVDVATVHHRRSLGQWPAYIPRPTTGTTDGVRHHRYGGHPRG